LDASQDNTRLDSKSEFDSMFNMSTTIAKKLAILQQNFDKQRLDLFKPIIERLSDKLGEAVGIFKTEFDAIPADLRDYVIGNATAGLKLGDGCHYSATLNRSGRRTKGDAKKSAPKRRNAVDVKQLLASMEIGKPYQQQVLAEKAGVTTAGIKPRLEGLKKDGALTVEEKGKGKGNGNHWTRVK
jgi:hypothetical protein